MEFIKKDIKLFLISGKARSGKGEASKIIEEYYKDKRVITISFGYYIKEIVKRVSTWDGSEETKPRTLLQQIGIELINKKIDNNLFIRRILEDISIFSYFYDIIIVDDVRLLKEITTLKEEYNDSISIRIKRDNYVSDLTNKEKEHITEVELDNYDGFDYIIENNNYEDFKLEIIKILERV